MSSNTNKRKPIKKVPVSSLEKMEQIVDSNRSLSWDGWDVVELIPSRSAFFKTNGIQKDGRWYIKNTYTVDRDGWRIPIKYVR
jgi:hypothetical protein